MKQRVAPAPPQALRQKLPQAVQRKPVQGNSAVLGSQITACACGGGCPRCQTQSTLQAKLYLSQPNDPYEQEADRVADSVVRMAEPAIQSGGSQSYSPLTVATIQRETRSPFAETEGAIIQVDEPELIQAKAPLGQTPILAPALAGQVQALRSGGQPLPAAVRTYMEPRFSRDFSQVKIHTHPAAGRLATALNARAFTLGNTVTFAPGQFTPTTAEGKRLIAHELAHVLQQTGRDNTINRVIWYPNHDTGVDRTPWSSLPHITGDKLKAQTDSGTIIPIWRPHDGTTYWCHGYTFGGSQAQGGPYSAWGQDVTTILADDHWRLTQSCLARPGDILVFYDDAGQITHSGIIRSASSPGGQIDEIASTVESKWGAEPLNTSSWLRNTPYGSYRCFSKQPRSGPCAGSGRHEV